MRKLRWVMEEFIIYKIINIKNSTSYIGCSKNFYNRKKEHLSKLKNNKHENKYLQRSWNKYGKDNFVFEIIEKLDSELEMFQKEKLLILKNNNLYNLAEGGQGGNTRINFTQAQHLNYNKKLSESILKSWKNPNRKRISAFTNITKERELFLKQKWSNCKLGGLNSNAKYKNIKIFQYDKKDILIKVWKDIYEIDSNIFNRKYIINCCNKKPSFKSHKKFKWSFILNNNKV